MFEMRKLFAREAKRVMHTGVDLKDVSLEEIQDETRACILEVLGSARIDRSCFDLEIRATGPLKDGLYVLNANLRLTRWERVSGVRLLMGLPILERGARRAIAASWVSSSAHFGGLWLHPSGQILERPLMKELGRDLGMLESAGAFLHMEDSAWANHSEPDRKATDWGGL
jgi:hypothetical protein